MPNFTPATGSTQHVVGVCVNPIGMDCSKLKISVQADKKVLPHPFTRSPKVPWAIITHAPDHYDKLC